MIIECPACGARAKLPDSKEGAKVRCSECERIYLAHPSGARASAKTSSSAMPVGIGAGARKGRLPGREAPGHAVTPAAVSAHVVHTPEVLTRLPHHDHMSRVGSHFLVKEEGVFGAIRFLRVEIFPG